MSLPVKVKCKVRAISETDSQVEVSLFAKTLFKAGMYRTGELTGLKDLKRGPSGLVEKAILLAPLCVVAESFCSQQYVRALPLGSEPVPFKTKAVPFGMV
ncbi:hypothetical protein D3C80_1179040 [compost metagenome]